MSSPQKLVARLLLDKTEKGQKACIKGIEKLIKDAIWDGYAFACNGVLPAGIEFMYGKRSKGRKK